MNDKTNFQTVVDNMKISRRIERIERATGNARAKLLLSTVTSMASGVGGVLTMAYGFNYGREMMIAGGFGLILASSIAVLYGRDMCDKISRLDNISKELKTRVMQEMQRG